MSDTSRTTAADGTELLVRVWEPAGEPRAGILIVHGLGEHSGRYEHIGEGLAQRGFRVEAFDLPGFGASGGTRAYVDRFDVFVTNVGARMAELGSLNKPVVLFGHSLGGLIALSYALSGRPAPDLLAVSAPALDADIPRLKKLAARVLSKIAPRLALPNDITGEQLSRDPAVGEAYFSDPLVFTKTTTRLGAESLAEMERVSVAARGGIACPTLVMHGGADTLVPTASSEFLGDIEGVERIVFGAFRHEPHNEEGGVAMLDTLTGWIDRNLPAAG